MTAYSDALSFRTSHYFVSYLSEVTATAVVVRCESRADGSQDWYGHAEISVLLPFVCDWLYFVISLLI